MYLPSGHLTCPIARYFQQGLRTTRAGSSRLRFVFRMKTQESSAALSLFAFDSAASLST
jgi:hypothetical protein